MEIVELIKACSELGILIVIAGVFLYIVVQNNKNEQEQKSEKKDIENDGIKKIQEQQNSLIQQLQEQNNLFMKHQTEYMEKMINGVIEGVTNHVPTKEETEKISKASKEIDRVLRNIVKKTGASRACLVQYHNGGRGVNHQSFLRMSMTNEQLCLGATPLMPQFKEQFRSLVAYLVHNVDSIGFIPIEDVEALKGIDPTMYEFMKFYDIDAGYGIRVKDSHGNAIGFMAVLFKNKKDADTKLVRHEMENQQSTIESLLRM